MCDITLDERYKIFKDALEFAIDKLNASFHVVGTGQHLVLKDGQKIVKAIILSAEPSGRAQCVPQDDVAYIKYRDSSREKFYQDAGHEAVHALSDALWHNVNYLEEGVATYISELFCEANNKEPISLSEEKDVKYIEALTMVKPLFEKDASIAGKLFKDCVKLGLTHVCKRCLVAHVGDDANEALLESFNK